MQPHNSVAGIYLVSSEPRVHYHRALDQDKHKCNRISLVYLISSSPNHNHGFFTWNSVDCGAKLKSGQAHRRL